MYFNTVVENGLMLIYSVECWKGTCLQIPGSGMSEVWIIERPFCGSHLSDVSQ